MLQSKKRTERKWRQRTTRNHILQLEHLYKTHPVLPTAQTKIVFQRMLEDAIRTGRTMTIDYLQHGNATALTGSVTTLFHARGLIELKTSTGLYRRITFDSLLDIRESI